MLNSQIMSSNTTYSRNSTHATLKKTIRYIERLIDEKVSTDVIVPIVVEMEIHDVAKMINLSKRSLQIFRLLPTELQAQVIFLLGERSRKIIVRSVSENKFQAILSFCDQAEVTILARYLDKPIQQRVVTETVNQNTESVTHLFQALPETAGELIKTNYIIARVGYTVADVAEKIEAYLSHSEEIPVIIATDEKEQVVGRVYFALLINASKDTLVGDIIRPALTVGHHVDQEVLLGMMKKSPKDDLIIAVDENNQPIGVIHAVDLLAVMESESTEDLLGFAGVHDEERALESVVSGVRHRYRWLILNLFTLSLAAGVVAFFEKTLDSLVILAIYMPLVAGMGGNAGTQTLALVVRGLALHEIDSSVGLKVIKKEMLVGLVNGTIVGSIVALMSILWHQNPMLGVVLGASMIINLCFAGFFGTIIPIALNRFKLDPAIGSSVFLTTMTDIIGFMVFLGLASVVLL